jgi:hypothetical protein
MTQGRNDQELTENRRKEIFLAQVTELRLRIRWKIRTYVRFWAKVFTTFDPARRVDGAVSAA